MGKYGPFRPRIAKIQSILADGADGTGTYEFELTLYGGRGLLGRKRLVDAANLEPAELVARLDEHLRSRLRLGQ